MEQYKTNVFEMINVTNAFLPLRQRRGGTVFMGAGPVGKRSHPYVASLGDSAAFMKSDNPYRQFGLLVGHSRISKTEENAVIDRNGEPMDVRRRWCVKSWTSPTMYETSNEWRLQGP